MIGVHADITERKQAEEKLEYIAHFDVLTNLLNRVLVADRLNHAMVQCQRRNRSLAVAYLDLDGFKIINDIHGHHVGDELLLEVSQRIKKVLCEGDTLARIGGDEFIVVMVDLESIEDSKPVLEGL
jgi:diguanylate cyclase (GGDEF)-like protein